MFNFFKNLFVEILVSVGIITSPTQIPPEEYPIVVPETQMVIEEEIMEPEEEMVEEIIETMPEVPVQQPIKPVVANTTPSIPVTVPEIIETPTPIEVELEEEVIIEPEIEVVRVTGMCGGNNRKNLRERPTEHLCAGGEPTDVEESEFADSWEWKCLGQGGGRDSITCRSYITKDAVCGTTSKPCEIGHFGGSVTHGPNSIQWTCGGMYGGHHDYCSAIK